MRIAGGGWRGQTLRVPTGDAVRPTQDRVREALFSMLQGELAGADAAAWAVLLSAERSRFPAMYGAPLVSYATAENGWLLFTLTSDFYSAAVMHTRSALPFPSRTDTYALHRMRMLSRRPTDDCPDVPEVQRLLLAFTAAELRTPAALANAERALLSMAYALPPADRQPLLDRCGGVADCACRLLSHVSG